MICRLIPSRRAIRILVAALLCLGFWQFGQGAYIPAKAWLAQELMHRAWKKAEGGEQAPPPWPWADTWPVAKLIVPQYDIEQIILAGDSGSSLAFGPGYSLASARPNTAGTTMISGHRDTHFGFLKNLRINDILLIQTTGSTVSYRIIDMQIVDSQLFSLQPDTHEKNLVLVTCYPFDTLTAGGTSRYLVYASAMPENTNPLAAM